MAERKLGEQWVEQGFHDNKMHLYKAVENPYETCQGCTFGCESCDVCHYCLADGGKCPVNKMDMVIKDLGILNEDGCLPSPWGGYPKIVRVGREDFCTYKVRFYLKNEVVYGFTLIEVTGNTRQEAIDAWNRRA
jgi:hypothetical protein